MTKKEIRQNMILQRNQLSKETVQENSNSIIENLHTYIQKAENIMIFMNMGNEVEVSNLITLYSDKKFYIPKTLSDRNMKINLYNENELILHKFGYYESASDIFYDEKILDLIIVPAVAFDYSKNRIGFGGGYYDTFLSRILLNDQNNGKNRNKPLIIGVCYDFQLIDFIPSEDHDVKMDCIITEKNIVI